MFDLHIAAYYEFLYHQLHPRRRWDHQLQRQPHTPSIADNVWQDFIFHHPV
jgi:hypothetical protein